MERKLVRAKGLEPPRLSTPEPKSGASTSSATPAPVKRAPAYSRQKPECKAAMVQNDSARFRDTGSGAEMYVRLRQQQADQARLSE